MSEFKASDFLDVLLSTVKVDQKNILIVGAGTVGLTVYRLLAQRHNVNFIEANPDHPLRDHPNCLPMDHFFDSPEKYVSTYDYCINTAPVYDPVKVRKVVEACASRGTHYLDFSEDVHVSAEIKDFCESRELSTLVAPHCGLAPGLIQIIANDLAEKFDTVQSIQMNVGSLPLAANNPLNYLTMWSAEGVVNEYTNPVTLIMGGEKRIYEPLSFHTDMTIGGRPYEAFATSGGCSTLLDTWEGRAENVIYRTIRYPGHLRALGHYIGVQQRRNTINLRPDFLETLKVCTPLTPAKDVVVILVNVYGVVNGEERMDQFTAEVYGLATYDLSAIQRLTAGGAAAVFDLHTRGLIKETGFLRQEEISLETLKKSHFYYILGI